jgi:acyl transferase domain-containing protein/thioesterase domain-containing protein/ubiquinone/menaquinone biosynthesis C-methylase UbiE/acyl carrier protein
MNNSEFDEIEESIAIIGMSCRLPGAKNPEEFWQNLKNGVESITFFSEQELLSSGIDPAMLKEPNYIKAKGALDNVNEFDAAFFGFSPKEAEITDPQQRLFLECAWEALENAGYDPKTYSGIISLYGGVGVNHYLLQNLYANPNLRKTVSDYQILINNDKDFLCTRVSYKLNLSGPSVTVQTACSTSLVAVTMAYQSLLDYQSDIALAGGVSISLPNKSGYLYQEGMIMSPDGHCRAFDANAQGTVSGNGAGIVVLKRLEDALNDGDHIEAVIKGAAINNDGALKIGYTAPSIEAQAQVIAHALEIATIPVETVSYVETHGTGTSLGDPIEIAALTQAFRADTDQKNYCAIGSVKTNIGHLDTAAGVAGLIKTVLALKHRQIPASLHFETPNPKLDLENSPFYVNTELSEWKTNDFPRRAGISSFGIGGTNAHLVLEEAPAQFKKIPSNSSYPASTPRIEGEPDFGTISERPWKLLLLSAHTETALEAVTTQLVEHLKQHPDLNLADVAYTYQVGRTRLNHCRMLVCKSLQEAISTLDTQTTEPVLTQCTQVDKEPSVVFMFSGQGSQYVNMGLELYQTEPVFREQIDHCAEVLKPLMGLDLRTMLYGMGPHHNPLPKGEGVKEDLDQTAITQPALFITEYALAKLWMSWGIQPKAMIGHSIGEYVAACLAGVFTLEEALALVATRGKLMQSVPPGAMLAVPLSEEEIQAFLPDNLDLSAINLYSQCVVSGSFEAIEPFAFLLAAQGIEYQRLQTSHAFHSEMMSPILTPFLEQVQKITLKPPKIPFISNVSGSWITEVDATDPYYWIAHLRQMVRFADGLKHVLQKPESILLEIGPGHTLSTFSKRHPEHSGQPILSSLRHPKEKPSDSAFLLTTVGQLWTSGIKVNWAGFYAYEQRYRLPLPTYPFERQHYWIEANSQIAIPKPQSDSSHKQPDIADWFYIPAWKRTAFPAYHAEVLTELSPWLVFLDECGLGSQLVNWLAKHHQDVITVKVGEQFTCDNAQEYTINPHQYNDYEVLLTKLVAQDKRPKMILHLWTVTPNEQTKFDLDSLEQSQQIGFYSLLFLAQALGKQNITDTLKIGVISNHLQAVTGEEVLSPEKATLLGPCKVIPQEYPNISCQSIDIVLPQLDTKQADKLLENLLGELTQAKTPDSIVAYRGVHRWVQTFEPIHLEKSPPAPLFQRGVLRKKGVYLITGGLGGMGLVLAEYLAKTVQANLILIGRSTFPNREEWETWLTTHDEQDSISRKIHQVQTLEEFGATVLVMSANVADYEPMQRAIKQATAQFGQIHGIIHTAGIAGGGVIQRKTPEIAAKVLAPKLQGTLILYRLFKEVQLDFMVLCSSLTSVLAGFGQVDYCGANAFLDAFAHYNYTQNGPFTLCINWDGWQKVGMAVNTTIPLELKEWREESLKQGILPQEGIEIFSRLLGNSHPQILVSTQDFQRRLEQPATFAIPNSQNAIDKVESNKPLHSRPALKNAYVAPRDALEQTIADSWQKLLGIVQIGIHDDFFDLGGDSLIAVRLITQLREIVQLDLSPHSLLLESPTIAKLADVIRQNRQQAETQSQKSKWPFSLIEIQAGNPLRPPLFLIHPAGGHVYIYRDLVHCLGVEQPVYGLQQISQDGKKDSLNLKTIEEMATHYIKALRVRQPEGPYCLGGASSGGTVAFEMAQQLHAMDQEVALLTLIDTVSDSQFIQIPEDNAAILAYLLNVGEGIDVSSDELRPLSHDEQLKYFLAKADTKKLPPNVALEQLVNDSFELLKLNLQAMSDYKPKFFKGQILFFHAGERDAFNFPQAEQGWDKLAINGVKVYEVPKGNHITMNYLPHVKVIADTLTVYLEKITRDLAWFKQQSSLDTFMTQEANMTNDGFKEDMRQIFNSVTQQLDSTGFGQYAYFLNFGYLADETPQQAVFDIPEHTLNRHAIKLVLELIGDCDLSHRKILDTGCGRGGTVSVIAQYFQAKDITGLDLSPAAIAFCQRTHQYPNVHFIEGDSENLPFENATFDIVTNVESASAYSNIHAFFAEVYRVLKMGGYFLYTDALPTQFIPRYLSALQKMGFILEAQRNITHNVLLSCDETANRHATAYGEETHHIMRNFLSLPGSEAYVAMKNGTMIYHIFRFKKHH